MKPGSELLISINMSRASRPQRLKAAEATIGFAARAGIDTLRVQPAWIQTPPAELAEAVQKWLKTGKRYHRLWITFDHPSNESIALALSASPYLEAVNLFCGTRFLASLSDAADALTLEIGRAEWDRLRPQIESALGGSFTYDVEELAG
jgi:hypothetical protein